VEHAERTSLPFRPLYERRASVTDKIRAVARTMYGADDVSFTPRAERDLQDVRRLGHDDLPVCIAKVPGSLSDDPSLRGRPRGFRITVREIQVAAGAGYLVVLTGDILRMPGLPKEPRAEKIDVLGDSILGVD
jgi:formate--tetrahydrofolate ligase